MNKIDEKTLLEIKKYEDILILEIKNNIDIEVLAEEAIADIEKQKVSYMKYRDDLCDIEYTFYGTSGYEAATNCKIEMNYERLKFLQDKISHIQSHKK